MAQVGVPYLDIAATSRQPQTDEEHIIIYRLDFEAFRALEASVRSVFRGEDPAYLAFAVRRMFFVQFYGLRNHGAVFPEQKPAVGSEPIPYYVKSMPWWVPGMEEQRRRWWPKGWDNYVEEDECLEAIMEE